MKTRGGRNGRGTKGEAGFSLVEVTLALLVVAVGMTAAFSLFPEAMRSTRAAVSNTETALFADYVFATLDLTAGYAAVDLKGGARANILDESADDFISYLFPKSKRKSKAKEIRIRTSSGKPEVFYWMPDFYGVRGGDEMKDSFFTDKLKTAAFTYQLSLKEKKGNGSTIVAVLKVWPGEYADGISTKDLKDSDARIFYREILPPK
ncbi:MAG: prepilin-type N-terminal cleavage/methylation domain-containing protein [Kiritimatiellae bacterium]|nr:prepilin-type N-terminal cleavage/methylation domain-containing protein [Kiritimatiellia bacterium]